ncbi:MAG: MFS transporter [Spirochaetales bacterium]|nr:MFS transporter [Spirochaetales bacterium]
MKTKLGFGVGDLGGNLFFTLLGFYLLFYLTDIVKLPAGLAGTAIMIGKIWDAVTDPVTGYLSDRTRTKWGRRRPYIFAGAILSFAGMAAIFSTPVAASPVALFAIVTLLFCFLNLAYTLVNIPYAALLPELTRDFDQRTTLTGYRMSFAVVGTVLGAATVLPVVGLFNTARTGWLMMGTIMGFIIMVSALITVLTIREPEHKEKYEGAGFIKTYIDTLGLKVFLLAVIPWTLFIAGTSVVQGSLIYYFKYIYEDEGLFNFALMLLLGVSLLFIPVWVLISKKIGKKKSYIIGMAIMSMGVMLFAFIGGQGRVLFALVLMAAAGVGLSTHYVMPHSILPDVVEYDAIKSGIRREGVFSSLWTFSSKIGQAVALALTGFILDLVRYNPDTALEPVTLAGIRILCGPVPVVFYIAGIAVLAAYPITREYYRKMIEDGAIPPARIRKSRKS